MGKTRHSKVALRVPTNYTKPKPRKDYQDNERPKNKPSSLFFKYNVRGVFREDQVDGHKSGGKAKGIYSRILRKKLDREAQNIINQYI